MRNILQQILLALVGLVFIASAVLKLLSVDSFENYIYSFGLLNFGLCNVAARLLIAFEMFLGLSLACRLFAKSMWWLAMAVLSAFSVFLLVQALGGDTENCHCFGEAVQLSPLQSLFKNVALIALLVFVYPKTNKPLRFQKWLVALFAAAALAATLIVSPPDLFFRMETSADGVNKELLHKIKNENNISKDKKILCFFGTFCKYCKLSANRITAFCDNGQIRRADIQLVFVGTDEGVQQFIQKTGTEGIDFCIISPVEFLDFTEGNMPVIILQQGDSLVGKLGYRSLTEENLRN